MDRLRRGDPKGLGILVNPGPQAPRKCLPGIEDCSSNRKTNLESHNRHLGRNSLGLSFPSREIGGNYALCACPVSARPPSALCVLLRKNKSSCLLLSILQML